MVVGVCVLIVALSMKSSWDTNNKINHIEHLKECSRGVEKQVVMKNVEVFCHHSLWRCSVIIKDS
jgi:hypothetical protein